MQGDAWDVKQSSSMHLFTYTIDSASIYCGISRFSFVKIKRAYSTLLRTEDNRKNIYDEHESQLNVGDEQKFLPYLEGINDSLVIWHI